MGALIISSCSKKVEPISADPTIINPIADYTITQDPTDGFTFKYNNLSKNFTKLEWRFGDDTLNTDDSPTHTFLSPGKYTTDLKAFSSTGNFSHKYTDILIDPDKILAVTTAKTGVTGQLKFSAVFQGKIATIAWTFNDARANPAIVTHSTDLNPIVTFQLGTFNSFSVTVTSDKGSSVTITKNVTTEGLATDITQSRIYAHSSNENFNQVNENSPHLIDGNIKTKFGYYASFPVPEIYTLQFPAPVVIKLYGLCNGNDSGTSRDPKEWYIEGSNDGNAWSTLDHITLVKGFYDMATDAGATSDAQRYNRWWYYPIPQPTAFSWVRWRIVSTFQSAFQMDEMAFFK
ncbi:PKD domain-containing protein [Mucilaginibacter sp. dw_454]|uniref:PKD domain-containing protein n=1 Tax=Mucilaginibacter sp. dw_454 TaxID=2720079 RepID=UPI001BD3BF56|nr:PKD domain-containing protein [Mucilaginibacter sp. dw_454]